MWIIASRTSGGHAIQAGGIQQLHLEKTLSGRTVEQNLVAIRLPNSRESNSTRTVQTEVDSAGPATTAQNPFGHAERAKLKLIVLTKGFVYELANILDVAKLRNSRKHSGVGSPIQAQKMREIDTSAQVRENGVSADKRSYRQNRKECFAREINKMSILHT